MSGVIGADNKMTIRQVVRKYEISRPTIMKDLKSGRLSGVQDPESKQWYIEPSEVERWLTTKKKKRKAAEAAPAAAPDQSALVDALQQRIDSLEKQLEKKDEQITQVQSTLDKQTLLLEHHQQESSKGIFKKLFGG
jgi:predicted site-specific integrase-resolvase